MSLAEGRDRTSGAPTSKVRDIITQVRLERHSRQYLGDFTEWERPPKVQLGGFEWEKWVGGWIGRYIIRNGKLSSLPLLLIFTNIETPIQQSSFP